MVYIEFGSSLPENCFGRRMSMKFNYENLHRKSPKPLWFRTFLRRYLNRFALLVAEEGFEPTTFQVAVPEIFIVRFAHSKISTAVPFASPFISHCERS